MAAASLLATPAGMRADRSGRHRSFHACLPPPLVAEDPGFVDMVQRAGVDTVWLGGFFNGHYPYPDAVLARARKALERAGIQSGAITVPLGHPGETLGDPSLNSPPAHWRAAIRADGRQYVGTSLHRPATEENTVALRHLASLGFRQCFVDDDFRLARSPGEIGGCFCPEHRAEFLQQTGYAAGRWQELIDDVKARRFTALLRTWVDFTCKQLTASFHAQARSFGGDFGIMVMYLGAEKAGIRLKDYRHAPMRVGELMFDDRSFGTPKGKTDELFSVLFHRRFASPERAFSESTAYPADRLSAENMAAKLVVSTLADVRHTMFMSGLTPFPRSHWEVLGPAMRENARIHDVMAGHRPRGPLHHFWGEAERWVGTDRPFSLWLASGIPFDVVDRIPPSGWTFLGDFDARELAAGGHPGKGPVVCRSSAQERPADALACEESLEGIFAFKRRILPELGRIPHVVEERPVVCAWYPTARRVLLWNLLPERCSVTLAHGARRESVRLEPLGLGMVEVTG